MKALISPKEIVYNYDNSTGARIAQVDENGFDIAEPLFWVTCNNSIVADKYYYSNGQIQIIPTPPTLEANT
jgi:hypothetical protein